MIYSSVSDIGNVRKLNEDEFFVDKENQKLFIVADGMGGHKAGDVASRMAINIVKNHYYEKINENMSLKEIEIELLKGIDLANKSIISASEKFEHLQNMGTTMNLVYFNDDKILFINIGDSRSYVITNDELKQISVDHSLVEELLKNGKINEEEAYNHPQRNIITSCLGAKSDYKVDIYYSDAEDNMKILLCTDGLSNLLMKDEINEIILNNEVEQAVQLLLNGAKENGGFDNITLILIDLQEKRF
ncbi:Stp1/IreP family PP2C-type Ser/Thr phosphatase [Clostridiaceae bacterium HSG29]|nr:Stp1/IreP family PP2C-type Ser/Thr phosphatase [Clostridiaceae bacterium HSG29]